MKSLNNTVDYWDKLNEDEKKWLRTFNREYEFGYRDRFHIPDLADIRLNDRRRAAKRRDLLNVAISMETYPEIPTTDRNITCLILRDFLEKTQHISLMPLALM